MSINSLLLILLSVSLSVAAQILLKLGMSNSVIKDAFDVSTINGVISILLNLHILGGLFAYVASAAVWLGVLSQIDVSKAYPFVGLGFIGTMLLGFIILNEPLNFNKLAGTFFVVLGVVLLSKS
ncbi:MAG: small multi-drug resistant family protein [Alteromonadaceae bacterium]|nr:small multi-drug resistant family protein [Alteromonadaceae bacterium]|tara:strand:+ start:127 stop:498 length:372 start_codon:yes stop_codon:yes gene_type:complete